MPKIYRERNKDIVQLFRIGWRKIDIAKLFKIEKSNNSKLIRRDFEKYLYPTLDELNEIEKKYNIKIREIKNITNPNYTPQCLATKALTK